ncbi:unnamed protein product [Eruca vesicaria subsp. sativa]|uniref:Uncharacterized protein n=1 Tax=Eruca vesicaria subsp. sativa TaxID=29727 RepID=A0ABC8M3X6_ERUVS|nr:unnamed protein product [Eruca vesicaria subsp. sativa]
MGSTYRPQSAHLADVKGKGILYEDDDDPIKLSVDDDANCLWPKGSTNMRRLASMIVSPTGTSHVNDANVTIRDRGVTRSLTFHPKSLQVEVNCLENDQMIGALNDMENDMEIVKQAEDGMLDCQDQDCDLLGEELKEWEES